MWSKWQCVMRIASICTPSASPPRAGARAHRRGRRSPRARGRPRRRARRADDVAVLLHRADGERAHVEAAHRAARACRLTAAALPPPAWPGGVCRATVGVVADRRVGDQARSGRARPTGRRLLEDQADEQHQHRRRPSPGRRRRARSADGRPSRASLSRAASAALPLFSAAVGLRPVRPRDSTTPAALPRCLVWRLRLVWAMPGA